MKWIAKAAKLALATLILTSLSGCLNSSDSSDTPAVSKSAARTMTTHELFEGGFAKNAIQAVLADQDTLYLATSHGLYSFDRQTLQPDSTWLKEKNILDIAMSGSGTLFAAVDGESMWVLPPGETRFYQAGTPPLRALAIEENQEKVWGATASGLVSWENGATFRQRIQSPEKFESQANGVTALAFDGQNKLWVGTEFGIYRLDENRFDTFYGNYQVVQGLSVVNHRGNSPLSGNLVYDIEYDAHHNRLLVATNGGLNIVTNPEQASNDSNWRAYTGPHTVTVMRNGSLVEQPMQGNSNLPGNFIRSATSTSSLIFAGTDVGLAVLKDSEFEVLTLNDGLAGDTILDLVPQAQIDEDQILVATNGGLSILTYPRKL